MKEEPKDHTKTLEIIGTVLLSVASLAVAWCSYQSGLWNGKQNFRLAESNLYYKRAQEKLSEASRQQQIDIAVTINFLEAVLDKRQNRIQYYLKRGRPGLAPVLTAWLSLDPLHNDNAPAHPLLMNEYKKLITVSMAASDSATSNAARLWQEAQHDNSVSDFYTLYTVIFSLVMFLVAISTKLTHIRIAYSCVVFACGIFVAALTLLLLTTPIAEISGAADDVNAVKFIKQLVHKK